MDLNAAELLAQLVRIPSVNPMGGNPSQAGAAPKVGNIFYEERLTDHLEKLFADLEMPTERQLVEVTTCGKKRENLLTRIDGSTPLAAGGELMLWEVHQDTVPADGMTVNPFGADICGGKMFGRGTCDVKGSMAAMIVALARLRREHPAGMPTIVLACTVNEEHGFSGARELVRQWQQRQDDSRTSLLPRAPDVCVVAEPTDLNVVIAHKGVVRWNCHTVGRAAHSSAPDAGENAIYKMGRVLSALETYARDIVPSLAEHALCGRPSLCVGTITGGVSVNTVPERCSIAIDRRLAPGETAEEAYEHAVKYLSKTLGSDCQVEHDGPSIESPGLTNGLNSHLAERVSVAAREENASGQSVGVPYGTDAAIIADAGVPAVVFGPGSIAQAHTADEWIDLEQLEQASEIYYRLAAQPS